MSLYVTTLSILSLLAPISSEAQCSQVAQCGTDVPEKLLGGKAYEIMISSWNGEVNSACPRSDNSVLNWQIYFIDDSNPGGGVINGSYCTPDTVFDSVCTRQGELIFINPSDFYTNRGDITFYFNSLIFNTMLKIRYASTGIFPKEDVIYFNENQPFVQLSYFIYSSIMSLSESTKVYHDGVLLNSPKPFPDTTTCATSTSGEVTTINRITLQNPPFSAAGEYELFMGNFSALITLIANFTEMVMSSSPSTVFGPLTSTIPPTVTTPILSPSVSSSPSSPSRPPSSDTDIGVILAATFIPILAVLVILITIACLVVVGCYWRRPYVVNKQQREVDLALTDSETELKLTESQSKEPSPVVAETNNLDSSEGVDSPRPLVSQKQAASANNTPSQERTTDPPPPPPVITTAHSSSSSSGSSSISRNLATGSEDSSRQKEQLSKDKKWSHLPAPQPPSNTNESKSFKKLPQAFIDDPALLSLLATLPPELSILLEFLVKAAQENNMLWREYLQLRIEESKQEAKERSEIKEIGLDNSDMLRAIQERAETDSVELRAANSSKNGDVQSSKDDPDSSLPCNGQAGEDEEQLITHDPNQSTDDTDGTVNDDSEKSLSNGLVTADKTTSS